VPRGHLIFLKVFLKKGFRPENPDFDEYVTFKFVTNFETSISVFLLARSKKRAY
jgi:hypothetical protein